MADLHLETLARANSDSVLRKHEQSELEDGKHPVERRDKLEIILTILEIAQQPIKKTHILYIAKINFYQLSRYLDLLLATNMIEAISEPIEGYKITEKGRLLLNMFR